MGRGPGDGDRNVPLHLVEVDIDASDNVFVCDRFNGAGRKEFNTIITIRNDVVSREEAGSRDLRSSGSSPGHDRRH